MKRVLSLSLLTLCLLVPAACAAQKEEVAKAERAATAWLALADSGRYAESWDSAAAAFKAAITRSGWEQTLRSIRSSLGTVKSRKIRSATFTRSLPDAPAGEYVIIQFDTQFANKTDAVETVTPMLDTDGSWRVSGYFIK